MKKTIVEINSCNYGSTGNIMLQIADKAREKGHIVYTSYPDGRDNRKKKVENGIVIGNRFSRNLHLYLAQFTGLNGCFSFFSTLTFLAKLKKIKPDIIHLHNLHNCYINLPLLFHFIKKHRIKTFWTLHDCWSFTGHCPHFTLANCNKWLSGCHHCPQYHEYPTSYIDSSKSLYRLKKRWFCSVEDLTIVTPSEWLAGLVRQSFLKEYPVRVINNGIDLSVFQPTDSNFREKHGLQDNFILLGVAFGWGQRKGLDVFVELARRLPDKYKIVLVGTNDAVDKLLPENILSIHRTQNQQALAEIYSAADLFVNPTREENYPTVNMESIACGTPVLTFRTGGSPEIPDNTCGSVVPCDDIAALEQEILRICEEMPYTQTDCVTRSRCFDMNERYEEYIHLYETDENT